MTSPTPTPNLKPPPAPSPSFLPALLSRPIPPLTPSGLSDARNPPYSSTLRAQIADARVHPLLEAALHLMNDDLFSAHFLLRKMQEDPWGRWLHAILHMMEGDLESNARRWYLDTDPEVLSAFFPGPDPCEAAVRHMERVGEARLRLRGPGRSRGHNDERGKPSNDSEEDAVRKAKWDELVCVMRVLEGMHGWGEVDGTMAYTRDETEAYKSRVLGEGYRVFGADGRRREN